MTLFFKAKDGGPESNVDGYFLIEWKQVFSIALLKFNKGRREAFHTHAFNAYTWYLSGDLWEEFTDGKSRPYTRSLIPKRTPRESMHRVNALTDGWCFTIRGPWAKKWKEVREDKEVELTWGRKEL